MTVAQPTPFSRSSTQGTDSVQTTGPTVPAPVSPGFPAPPTVKPSSDHISIRTRRRTSTAAGNAPPAVDYGFGFGWAPRPYARRAITPPRVPRPRPAPSTAAIAPAASPVPTVSIPSDRNRTEPVETPLLRLPPPPGDTPTTPTKLDALGDAIELQFADSVSRYWHADWEREQQAESACHGSMRYITIGRPSALPPDFLSCHPSHQRPSLSDIQELAGKGRLRTPDDDIVLLVCNSPLLTMTGPPSSVGRAACLLNDTILFSSASPYSCALGSCKLAIRLLLDILAPRAHCACWNGFTGGSA